MSTDIRQSESYTKFYDIDLPGGKEWEGFFASIVASGKIECKRDKLTHNTGNVFIEYWCRGKPSGLSITQANWWAIGIEGQNGDIEVAILVSVPWLKAKCRTLWKTSKDVVGGDDKLSRGILLSLEDFNK